MSQSNASGLADEHRQTRERFEASKAGGGLLLTQALDCALAIDKPLQGRPRSVDVALGLLDLGVDQATLIAALLSDPRLRDDLQVSTIRHTYGDDIAQLVNSVHWLNTFRECECEQIKTPEQAERLRRMLLAMVKDIRAMLIKLVYRLQRLRLLPGEGYDIRRCIARETLDIYAPLAHRLGIAKLKWELEDLAFRYLNPLVYKRIASALEETRAARESYVSSLVDVLKGALQKEQVVAGLSGRPKHIYSIWQKMRRKGQRLEQLYDLSAVRIVVQQVSECYAVLGMVHALWRHVPEEFDDYIANPKRNGYQSLHTAIIGPQGKIVEVQIRTREMHDFAERGVAAHWFYKEGGRQKEMARSSVLQLQNLLEADHDGKALLDSFKNGFLQDRVFVLTPAADIQELPRGATPLDFAYSIHTEVGHCCRGAKVNGRIVSLNYTLKSGDRVEILTAKQGRPSRDWLNPQLGFLITSRAKAKVRHWLKHQNREQNVADGRSLIDREFQRLGLKGDGLEHLVHHFNLHHIDELYAEVGRGEISVMQIVGMLQVPDVPAPKLIPIEPPTPRKKERSASEIKVKGVGNLLTQLARCCNPMPGDSIIGYITRGKGITVHRAECTNMLNLPEDL
ncbi:MAG: bifunctional (p)ppGpp synthetase/guanosine-3',5'-bis(diphosphate) 3'-pyrophosphohydrolase, partial [Pseudomonadota bacterium]